MEIKVVDNDVWECENGDAIVRIYCGRRHTTPKYVLISADLKNFQAYRSLKGAKGQVWGEEVKLADSDLKLMKAIWRMGK